MSHGRNSFTQRKVRVVPKGKGDKNRGQGRPKRKKKSK